MNNHNNDADDDDDDYGARGDEKQTNKQTNKTRKSPLR